MKKSSGLISNKWLLIIGAVLIVLSIASVPLGIITGVLSIVGDGPGDKIPGMHFAENILKFSVFAVSFGACFTIAAVIALAVNSETSKSTNILLKNLNIVIIVIGTIFLFTKGNLSQHIADPTGMRKELSSPKNLAIQHKKEALIHTLVPAPTKREAAQQIKKLLFKTPSTFEPLYGNDNNKDIFEKIGIIHHGDILNNYPVENVPDWAKKDIETGSGSRNLERWTTIVGERHFIRIVSISPKGPLPQNKQGEASYRVKFAWKMIPTEVGNRIIDTHAINLPDKFVPASLWKCTSNNYPMINISIEKPKNIENCMKFKAGPQRKKAAFSDFNKATLTTEQFDEATMTSNIVMRQQAVDNPNYQDLIWDASWEHN